jgi:diacylglycerol kinase family enzyme/HPt (histidine-containing phosphotransfer) domain-containing protein
MQRFYRKTGMKHFFVINPHSFRTLADMKQILIDLENCFPARQRTEYKIYISRYPRDALGAVYRYLEFVRPDETVRVYAVGGDGILFDCLNGMVTFPNAELTGVPYGIANDFVKSFGENAAPAFRDIKNLISAPSRPVDIIHCGTNYALIEVNVGLIGKTLIESNETLRKKSESRIRSYAPEVYILNALKALGNAELMNQYYTITVDGEDVSGNYSNIHIANIAWNGGVYLPNPYALPNDGELNTIFMHSSKNINIIRSISDRNKGHFEKHKIFEHKKCRTMDIKSELPLCIEMDGESFYASEMQLKIIPDGIKFFAPEGMEFVDYSHRAYKGGTDKPAPVTVSKPEPEFSEIVEIAELPEQPPDLLSQLRDLDGFDADSALKAMGGMLDVYTGAVKLTVRLLPETIRKMDESAGLNDIEAFTIEIHGLKSVLLNIGAITLGNAASRLEQMGKEKNKALYDESYPLFRSELIKLESYLKEAFKEKSAEEKTQGEWDVLLSDLLQARSSAESYDNASALEILTPHIELKYNETADNLLKEIVAALEEFDCEGAVNKINKLEGDLSNGF